MKTVMVPLYGARFIIFSDEWYDNYDRFPKPIDTTVVYYKYSSFWSEDDEKLHETVNDILNGVYRAITVPYIISETLDMTMEEHELYLALLGFTKYERKNDENS